MSSLNIGQSSYMNCNLFFVILQNHIEIVVGSYIYEPLKELSNYFLPLIEQIISVGPLFFFRTV